MTHVTERPRVLLAEDDPELRDLLRRRLAERGMDVVAYAHGLDLVCELEQDISSIRRRPVDVVVADVRMPGVTGISVLEGLAELGHDCAFVLMTAFGDARLHEHACRLGADAFFDKPFDVGEFVNCVQRLSERKY